MPNAEMKRVCNCLSLVGLLHEGIPPPRAAFIASGRYWPNISIKLWPTRRQCVETRLGGAAETEQSGDLDSEPPAPPLFVKSKSETHC